MTILEIAGIISLSIILITNIVLMTRFLVKLELKPSEERVGEMIEEKFENHCPFTDRVKSLEINKIEQATYRELLSKELHQENEKTHLSLQRMELNLKRVCDKLELDYLT